MADLLSWCLAIEAEIAGKPCPKCGGTGSDATIPCDTCHGSGKSPPEVCEGEELVCQKCGGHGRAVFGPAIVTARPCAACNGSGGNRRVYHCPIVLICADWLEERGDPRVEMLRGMRIEDHAAHDGWRLYNLPLDTFHEWQSFPTLADASRELLRRALELLTVPCPTCRTDDVYSDCKECQGLGWLAADAVECKACGGRGEKQIDGFRVGGVLYVSPKAMAEIKKLSSVAGLSSSLASLTILEATDLGHEQCEVCHGLKFVKIPLLNRPPSV